MELHTETKIYRAAYGLLGVADDTFYVPEGWYECIDNWDDFTSILINEGVIDYVMPLPKPPEDKK
jgi:hypothetical protein